MLRGFDDETTWKSLSRIKDGQANYGIVGCAWSAMDFARAVGAKGRPCDFPDIADAMRRDIANGIEQAIEGTENIVAH